MLPEQIHYSKVVQNNNVMYQIDKVDEIQKRKICNIKASDKLGYRDKVKRAEGSCTINFSLSICGEIFRGHGVNFQPQLDVLNSRYIIAEDDRREVEEEIDRTK